MQRPTQSMHVGKGVTYRVIVSVEALECPPFNRIRTSAKCCVRVRNRVVVCVCGQIHYPTNLQVSIWHRLLKPPCFPYDDDAISLVLSSASPSPLGYTQSHGAKDPAVARRCQIPRVSSFFFLETPLESWPEPLVASREPVTHRKTTELRTHLQESAVAQVGNRPHCSLEPELFQGPFDLSE